MAELLLFLKSVPRRIQKFTDPKRLFELLARSLKGHLITNCLTFLSHINLLRKKQYGFNKPCDLQFTDQVLKNSDRLTGTGCFSRSNQSLRHGFPRITNEKIVFNWPIVSIDHVVQIIYLSNRRQITVVPCTRM